MVVAKSPQFLFLLLCGLAAPNGTLPARALESTAGTRSATYQVRHALTVKDIPSGSKSVRVWFWLPDDDECQDVLELVLENPPPGYRITRDAANGHRYLYAELNNPASGSFQLSTRFTLRRRAVALTLDPAKAVPLSSDDRARYAEYLRPDCPHMEVTEKMIGLAKQICGDETNVVLQARKLFDFVVDNTKHYSLANAPKSSGQGDAQYCLDKNGGSCTDQHAFFIALARARGIPTRLQFGSRLQVKNEGKDVDPGYRCWVNYFVPGYGWVPMDIAAANTTPAERDHYFSGLDERRIRFSEGRDLELNPRQRGPKVNLFIAAYVEVDEKPHSALDRVMNFTQLDGNKP